MTYEDVNAIRTAYLKCGRATYHRDLIEERIAESNTTVESYLTKTPRRGRGTFFM